MSDMYNPPHPGEILADTVLRADGGALTVTEFAKHLGVTRAALSRVVNGRAGVSADMDLRLSKALGTTPGTWYKMQADYDLWHAQRHFRAKVKPLLRIEARDGMSA
jgi:addiction module HigA family antidote